MSTVLTVEVRVASGERRTLSFDSAFDHVGRVKLLYREAR